MKDCRDCCKTKRGCDPRSLNSNGGWNVTGCMSYLPILQYSQEIRSAVPLVYEEKAHSCYFSRDTFEKLAGGNKELLLIPGAVHTALYDRTDIIPFHKLEAFFRAHLCGGMEMRRAVAGPWTEYGKLLSGFTSQRCSSRSRT